MPNNASGKPDAATSEIREFKKGVGEFFDKLVCKQKAHLLPRRQPPPLENLRSSYQELEIKLKEAEQQKERAEKQLAEKNSELIREKGDSWKRNADSETIKRQQKELNGLRKYMETTEHHWDLLAENILEPLGYPEKRRNKFPRDDVLSLAGDDCKDLISASRKICHNLSLKKSRTCGLRKLIKRMDILPELMSERFLMRCGYDTRIARRIRHEEFYDKVVLPADEPLEDELQKSATRKPVLRIRDPLPGPAPRMLPKRNPRPALQPPKKMKRAMKMCRLRLRAPKEKIQRAMLLRPRRSENVYVLRDKTMHHFGPSEGL
ncbi:hypothetical protein QYE76_010798 [Lolium multiflorum]|uniref:Uncharacterized protein n=1 Tax=Lolium multiflorum TaxID=4521 RepID=A0AAD8TUD7_LOLMU|nr:hypothetical protein QYE76_010798 [Lolium multiflorum]